MATTAPASTGPPTLQRNAVGTFGALAQSLGAISPAGTVAVMGALIVPLAGTGTWLTVLFQMIVVLCTGWIIIRLARRFATTGGLYGLNSRCAGRLGGVLTALAIVFIGLAALPAMVVVFANYTASFFNLFGTPMSKPVLAGFCVLGAVLAAFFSYKEIKLSVMVMLALQALSIAMMVLLFSIVLAHAPHIIDGAQFGLHGVTVQGLALGMVIGIFAYEGFESATVFGQEARNPNHVIPRAVVGSLIITGLLFTFAGYSLVLGYNGHLPALIASPNPLTDLANRNGVHWLSYLVDIGIIVATFAVIIATINLVARSCSHWPASGCCRPRSPGSAGPPKPRSRRSCCSPDSGSRLPCGWFPPAPPRWCSPGRSSPSPASSPSPNTSSSASAEPSTSPASGTCTRSTSSPA